MSTESNVLVEPKKKPATLKVEKDPKRYVLATLHTGGNEAIQNPLPVIVNGERAMFPAEEPVIVPAWIVDSAKQDGHTTYVSVPDEVRKVPKFNKYNFEVEELDPEFQTVAGAVEYAAANGIPDALLLGKTKK